MTRPGNTEPESGLELQGSGPSLSLSRMTSGSVMGRDMLPLGLRQVAERKSNVSDSGSALEHNTLRAEDHRTGLVRGYRLLTIGETRNSAHRLPEDGEVTLGRSDTADIHIPDPLMSRVHAVIRVGPTLTVTDNGSSNGTLVRGVRIAAHEPTTIAVGDTIEMGSTVAIVQPEFVRASGSREASNPELSTGSSSDDPMGRIYKLARRVAVSNINVLLLGETGVGKEVLARAVHKFSERAEKPFLGLNCASLSETLFESELFGYEKGAFTGAGQSKPGLIESADGGTVFLDELGEMPLSSQAKLLRVIEDRQVLRVGSLRPRDVDVRFVAATHQNLEKAISEGRFREDLFYRLNGISLIIPPLRERPAELFALARQFIAEASMATDDSGTVPVLSREAMAWMRNHAWPGNIRELKNAINRAVLLAAGGVILPEHLRLEAYAPKGPRTERSFEANTTSSEEGGASRPPRDESESPKAAGSASSGASGPVVTELGPGANTRAPEGEDAERERIVAALAVCGGNQTRAAKMLGIARRTLTNRLGKLGLPRPRKDRVDDEDAED